jgi:hypothetical protein
MAGDREAAGAIAGMQEVYGRPLPRVGEWVRGECRGRRFEGEVVAVYSDLIEVQVDCMTLAVLPESIH